MSNANRGSSKPCETCGIPHANQHSIAESAKCDGIRGGYLHRDGTPTGKTKGQTSDEPSSS